MMDHTEADLLKTRVETSVEARKTYFFPIRSQKSMIYPSFSAIK